MFLQSFVTPIYTYNVDASGRLQAAKLMGTGFFVGKGVLITAAHVLHNAISEIDNGNAKGVCANPKVKKPNGDSEDRFVDISNHSFADAPYDVAVAMTEYDLHSDRALGPVKVEIANDIAALGYPESAFQVHEDVLYVQARVHRGYVQRVIPRDRHVVGEKSPPMFELDFPVTAGMSGSPLLMMVDNKEFAVGVCVGSHTSRLVDYRTTYVDDGGAQFTEEQVRVQEYGLAHDLIGLLSWRPKALGGMSLEEASA